MLLHKSYYYYHPLHTADHPNVDHRNTLPSHSKQLQNIVFFFFARQCTGIQLWNALNRYALNNVKLQTILSQLFTCILKLNIWNGFSLVRHSLPYVPVSYKLNLVRKHFKIFRKQKVCTALRSCISSMWMLYLFRDLLLWIKVFLVLIS